MFFEEFRFSPGGFVHAACTNGYFDTTAVIDRCLYFSPGLAPDDIAELRASMEAAPAAAAATGVG